MMPRAPRRIVVIAALVFLVATAAHGTLWWWVSRQIEQQVAATIATPPMPAWRASAGALRRGGWPLAATVEVPMLVVEAQFTPGEPVRWHAERLTVALELARPRTVVVSVFGAQKLQFGTATPIPISTSRLRAEVPLEPGLPTRAIAIEVANLQASLPEGQFSLGLLDLTAETRPAAQQGEPAMVVVATARDVVLPPVRQWPLGPRIDRLLLDLMVTGPVPRSPDLAERAEAWRDGGGAVEVRRLEVAWGAVALSGGATLALDARLQPMGAATARVAGHAEALRALTSAGLLTPRSALAAGAVLALMARPPPEGGPPVVEVPLSLQSRTLALGRIPLLKLPELIWRPPS